MEVQLQHAAHHLALGMRESQTTKVFHNGLLKSHQAHYQSYRDRLRKLYLIKNKIHRKTTTETGPINPVIH